MSDLISRQQALKEMWKALYEYEDKTEKQFQKSKDLDVRDWIMNDRSWVQNGHNLCVNVLANLPSAQPDLDEWCPDCKEYDSKRHCCPRFNRVIRGALKDVQSQRIPCDWCKYNPPSSMDGKPCTICPAVGRGDTK